MNTDDFRDAVSSFTKIIRESCAEPILFMTWGRDRYPNFKGYLDMQDQVGRQHEIIPKQLNITMADVGWLWRGVYNDSYSTWKSLYQLDHYHPSKKGELLVDSTFFRLLYNSDLSWVPYRIAGVSARQWSIIKSNVLAQDMPLSNRRNCVKSEVTDTGSIN